MKSIIPFLIILFIGNLIFAQPDPMIGCHQHSSHSRSVPGLDLNTPMDDTRSDSIDIINYTINIDLTSPPSINANTIITAEPIVANVDHIKLDLLDLIIDSVFVDNEKKNFTYDGFQFVIDFEEMKQPGETFDVQVYYQGIPTRDPSGFGGLVYESGYFYNLGIGIASNPHNFGRGWFPCFDNFMERSTFEYNVTHLSSTQAHCVGTEIGIVDNGDGSKTTSYVMDQLITTYQSSIAVADYTVLWSEHEGAYGTIPIKLICMRPDTTRMKGSFENLGGAIDCIESWYGEHVWERVGYVATTVGAMEHPTNIAYPISSINGSAESNTRLMSHELTHNWFGNLITLTTERDMWIKEGPAEYGYHLTAECLYGEEEFLEVVKDNHLYVLENAHIDDEEFRALSGMPNEFTYGTHTYRKGASVIHNLRGYLGDEEFSQGMKAILENYQYSHLDAADFEEVITNNTSIDASDFFDAWIYNPGFSVFVTDSIISVDNNDGTYSNNIFLHQKLRGTDIFHNNVPLTYTVYGFNGETQHGESFGTEEYSGFQVITDFPVKRIALNPDNKLNQARMAEDLTIDEKGNYTFERTALSIKNNEDEEPFLARVEHIWAKPGGILKTDEYELSDRHYWIVAGEFPEETDITGNFFYSGGDEISLDYSVTLDEDSVMVFYRPDITSEWLALRDFSKIKGTPNDGKGLIRLEHFQPGEYTIGKGDPNVTNTIAPEFANFEIYPNPADSKIFISASELAQEDNILSIYDINGHLIYTTKTKSSNKKSFVNVDISSFKAGTYFAKISNEQSGYSKTEKFVIIN